MANLEQIKKLEQEINNLDVKKRTRLRQLFYQIELQGGYIARGFTSLEEYYKNAFPELNSHHLGKENLMKDYELLLKVPLGTYAIGSLAGLKEIRFLILTKNSYYEHFCLSNSLEKATKIREVWQELKVKFGGNPTAQQIQEHFKAIGKIKERRPSSSKKSNDRIRELEAENQLLLREIEKLKTPTEKNSVHPTTQQHISWLNEQNQKLRDKIAKLENLLRQTQKVA